MKTYIRFLAIGLGVLTSYNGAQAESYNADLCSSYFEKQLIRQYYFGWGGHPADPMAIPSHSYRIVESKVVSSFSDEKALGVYATPKRFDQIWKSIDEWGETTPIKVVLTVDGWHAFAFPTNVPMTQNAQKEDHKAGFYDVSSLGDVNVRGSVDPSLVSLVYAVKLPLGDGTYQRSVSFYGHSGDLILGLYASEGGKPQNADAIKGFDRTWAELQTLPRACKN